MSGEFLLKKLGWTQENPNSLHKLSSNTYDLLFVLNNSIQ